jgi:hypothetical protein
METFTLLKNQILMHLSVTDKKYSIVCLILVACSLVFMGCEGPAGPEGPQGTQGQEGPQGPVGPAGEDGSRIFSGSGAPDAGTGSIGDYYLDTITGELYGPKDNSGWGSPAIVLMGEDGQDGADGEDGSQIYSGTGAPDASLGAEGDYYLDTSSYELYGPKTASGWGSPLNLKGADGNANVTLYIFNPDPFTTTDPQHTFEISGLQPTEIFESSWDFAFTRGAFKQFIPGKINFGTTPSEFTVEMFFDSSTGNVEFRVELINGSDYFPDELHVFKIAPTNVVNNKMGPSGDVVQEMKPNRVDDYQSLINFYGEDHIEIVDFR